MLLPSLRDREQGERAERDAPQPQHSTGRGLDRRRRVSETCLRLSSLVPTRRLPQLAARRRASRRRPACRRSSATDRSTRSPTARRRCVRIRDARRPSLPRADSTTVTAAATLAATQRIACMTTPRLITVGDDHDVSTREDLLGVLSDRRPSRHLAVPSFAQRPAATSASASSRLRRRTRSDQRRSCEHFEQRYSTRRTPFRFHT